MPSPGVYLCQPHSIGEHRLAVQGSINRSPLAALSQSGRLEDLFSINQTQVYATTGLYKSRREHRTMRFVTKEPRRWGRPFDASRDMSQVTDGNRSCTQPWLEVFGSRHLSAWLAEHNVSLALTTYQQGKLLAVGRATDERFSVFERTFSRCMGLWSDGPTIWMSSSYQLWRLENSLRPGHLHDGYDALYVPRVGYTTGDVDVHDLVVERSGRVVFVNTSFSCLATLSPRLSFQPLWRPPFVDKLVPEDRCHLNGLALVEGRVAYVTAVSQSNVADGWRDQRRDGGCVIDARNNQVVATGLSMPHSPRCYRDRLWVLDSGRGYLGQVDLEHGRFLPVTFCPGYLRGLTFVGNYAVVGLSRPRYDATFGGLQLQEELDRHNAKPQCGLHVIDLASGEVVHWLRLEGDVTELYDVAALPGVARPMVLGFRTDEIQRMLAVDGEGTL